MKNSTISRSMEVVRTTLIRAARVWREEGVPWLSAPPLIEMLDQKKKDSGHFWPESLIHMARLAGFEPTTPWFVA